MLGSRITEVLKSRTISGDGVRFIIAGGFNTLLTLALYQILVLFVNHQLAYALSWLAGITYLLLVYPNKVFPGSCLSWQKFALIVCIYISVFILGLQALDLFVEVIGSTHIAIFFAMLITTAANFLLMRLALRARSEPLRKE